MKCFGVFLATSLLIAGCSKKEVTENDTEEFCHPVLIHSYGKHCTDEQITAFEAYVRADAFRNDQKLQKIWIKLYMDKEFDCVEEEIEFCSLKAESLSENQKYLQFMLDCMQRDKISCDIFHSYTQ